MHDAGAMLHPQLRHWLAPSALALCVSGCAPENERSRITTELQRDGYALFEVRPGGAERVAFLVEMRDVEEGEFVLLYTSSEPKSSGWFEIDPSDYEPCSEDVTIDCIIPNGHGALADFAVADGSATLVLRHQLTQKKEGASNATNGWYAVMRIEKSGAAVPMAVEVVSMDETEPFERPKVERVR